MEKYLDLAYVCNKNGFVLEGKTNSKIRIRHIDKGHIDILDLTPSIDSVLRALNTLYNYNFSHD